VRHSIAYLSMFLLVSCIIFVSGAAAGLPANPAQPTTTAPDDYVLGSGDQIDITVFGQPDLTATATIRPDGMIALPLVGEVKAGGETVARFEAELTRLYRKYLKAPSVSVALRQFRMNHIYVMGEVAKPGRYDLTDNMTVLDALTLAGGSTGMANLDGTHISRNEAGKSKTIAVKVNQLIQGKDAGQNLKLQSGDLIYVPRRGLNLLDILNNIGILRYAVGY
jgi:polysaccharide biosynthesis/export protein